MSEMKLKEEERQKCEVWSRVMGYHRPISHWNIGKIQEFQDRKYFKEVSNGHFKLDSGKLG